MMKKGLFPHLGPSPHKIHHVFHLLQKRYDQHPDPWGLDLEKCQKYLEWFWPLYTHYFRVRVHGKENVSHKPYMVVSNHSGQLPFDGILIAMAFLMEIHPPRILRAMVERFLAGFPFLGEMAAESGFILGDRQNCHYLLENCESILVFPEGVRGIAKSTKDYYQLQPFSKGFFRMALETRTDILPLAVVGAEEFYPYVLQAPALARTLGLPALPITPFFPLMGLAGLIPLPSPVDIFIGKPYEIPREVSPQAPDSVIDFHVTQIENQIRDMLAQGREKTRKRKSFLHPWLVWAKRHLRLRKSKTLGKLKNIKPRKEIKSKKEIRKISYDGLG